MVYTNKYRAKNSQPQVLEFNLTATDDLTQLYDQVEIVLCAELNSGFGRNLDALYDVLTGGFGLIYNSNTNTDDIIYNINVYNSKLLSPKILKIFKAAGEYNKEINSINILFY